MDLVSACLMFEYTNTERTEDNYRRLYKAIDATIDEDTLVAFCKKTHDMNIEEIQEKGNSIVESIALQCASAAPQAAVATEEVKKEEVKEEEEEAVEVNLFGGDDDFF